MANGRVVVVDDMKVREGLPPDGFWTNVSQQLKGKADKQVGHG